MGNQGGGDSMITYSTSEIARTIGLHPNTIMLYEKWGYIDSVPRKENGYRVYNETHLKQMKLIRLALRSEVVKWYMRFEIKNIIKSAAQGNFEKALELSNVHLSNIQNEKNNEIKVVEKIREILRNYSVDEKGISLNRNGVAKLLGVSKHVIINWERYGLIEVPRSKNGYRVYGEKEIKLFKIIKNLREESYSTQSISTMLKKLETKIKGNDIHLSEEIENSNDCLLSSLSEAESNAKELIDYIGELISKKTEI